MYINGNDLHKRMYIYICIMMYIIYMYIYIYIYIYLYTHKDHKDCSFVIFIVTMCEKSKIGGFRPNGLFSQDGKSSKNSLIGDCQAADIEKANLEQATDGLTIAHLLVFLHIFFTFCEHCLHDPCMIYKSDVLVFLLREPSCYNL